MSTFPGTILQLDNSTPVLPTKYRFVILYKRPSLREIGISNCHIITILPFMGASLLNQHFFLIRLVGDGVQLGPLRTAVTDWPIVACPRWLWWRRILWNKDWQEKPKNSQKTHPSATLSTTNPTWPDPESNSACRGGKPTTNRLSYVAALSAPLHIREKKVRWSYPCNMLWRPIGFWDVEAPTCSTQSARR
jgi:hypothetical protein